jgi:hypothetical protein
MDKKEFIFPGTILGIVLIIAIGLIITQPRYASPLPSTNVATSTSASTTSSLPTGHSGTVTTTHPVKPSTPTHYYPYGTTVLGVNQVAGYMNGVSIRPIAVLADNRCPVEVYCIQAGTITLSLKVSAKGQSTVENIHLGQKITVSGMQIIFESADPVRHMAGNPDTNAYRFTFNAVPVTN